MGSSSLAWLPWTIVLSGLGLFAAWLAFRKGDRSAVVRRLGWSMLPWGLYFMGLIRFTVRVTDALVDWATGFAFSPLAWLGVGLSVVSVLMIGGGAFLSSRRGRKAAPAEDGTGPEPKQVEARPSKQPASADDDNDDIEAILRRHGIE